MADEPRCSARVNRSRQSTSDVGADVPEAEAEAEAGAGVAFKLGDGPRSNEMSQNGSTVVDTPLQKNKGKWNEKRISFKNRLVCLVKLKFIQQKTSGTDRVDNLVKLRFILAEWFTGFSSYKS